MKVKQLSIPVSDSTGRVSAEIIEAEDPEYMMVLAHGAGAGMQHPFMKKLAQELSGSGISTLRFNFPYMEKGSKRPDPAPIAEKTVKVMLEKALELYPTLRIICSGKSFGGRMSSQLLCKHNIPFVRAIIFYGFPLHPVNKVGKERADHLSGIKIPMLFLQGTNDALARFDMIQEVCMSLSTSTLVTIEGADHSFKVGKKDSIVYLAKKTGEWLRSSTKN